MTHGIRSRGKSRSLINNIMKWWKKQQQHHQPVQSKEQQRAEKLVEIGATLRLQRLEKQLSFEQLEAQTRIRQRHLQAIEAGKLDQLPEPIYIQGFIKQYAEALGLDGTELASTFPVRESQPNIKPVTRMPAAQLQTNHLYLLYVLLIVGAVSTLSHMLSRSELPISKQMQKPPLISSAAKPNKTGAGQTAKVKSASTDSKTSKPVEVGMTLKAESWIRVIADGKKLFEGLLPQGTQRTWVANEQLTLRVGNAGGVLVTTIDQKEAKPLGGFGQVEEVTFAPKTRL